MALAHHRHNSAFGREKKIRLLTVPWMLIVLIPSRKSDVVI
jgi:hypothetical protein